MSPPLTARFAPLALHAALAAAPAPGSLQTSFKMGIPARPQHRVPTHAAESRLCLGGRPLRGMVTILTSVELTVALGNQGTRLYHIGIAISTAYAACSRPASVPLVLDPASLAGPS